MVAVLTFDNRQKYAFWLSSSLVSNQNVFSHGFCNVFRPYEALDLGPFPSFEFLKKRPLPRLTIRSGTPAYVTHLLWPFNMSKRTALIHSVRPSLQSSAKLRECFKRKLSFNSSQHQITKPCSLFGSQQNLLACLLSVDVCLFANMIGPKDFASAFGVALPNAYAFPRISTTVAMFH
jgi:hypothetical protein